MERIERVRLALGHRRDIHAMCDMAIRWLGARESVERFARSLSAKDYAKVVAALRREEERP